jgi:DNA adenine methylase
VRNTSPLRYPGGKGSVADLLQTIRTINRIGNLSIAEPFAGGAGASLNLLVSEDVEAVRINDLDPAIHAFWWALLHENAKFVKAVESTPVNLPEWKRQRDVYRSRRIRSLFRRGFSAFYLNRCNRSGIVFNGGPIGGMKQSGDWKVGARYYREELSRRCSRIGEFGDRIKLTCLDGIEFIGSLEPESWFMFIDPPYYEKGHLLYLNTLNDEYHASLAERLKRLTSSAWVLTYDDCPAIRKLYSGWASLRSFSLRYVASTRRSGRELLITPKWMKLPRNYSSAMLSW